jgi:HNH endonuclease
MNPSLVRQVWIRAKDRCEYCRLSQDDDDRIFEVDHIISEKHHGSSTAGNLALSCFRCNSFKGSDISGRDPLTRKLTPLFNPRRHKWSRHFHWDGPQLIGRTPMGRTTVGVLRINDPFRVKLREALIEEGIFPPET